MTFSVGLWLFNAFLGLMVILYARNVLTWRKSKMKTERSKILSLAVDSLSDRPELHDLLALWAPIAAKEFEVPESQTNLSRCILALDHADVSDVNALREMCHKSINKFNGLASQIDEGLLRPKDLVRSNYLLHLKLLKELSAISPMIWYDSLLGGRGRWGYRPLQLSDILADLRPVSNHPELSDHLSVFVGGLTMLDLTSISTWQNQWYKVRLIFRSPTINVKSKLQQQRQSIVLAELLKRSGSQPVPLALLSEVIYW